MALFTLSVSAGCRGFLAINDWIESYRTELLELFRPAKLRLPSYSTIRRVMLRLDYQAYSSCLGRFFQIELVAGETIAMDGKVLRGSYNRSTNASTTDFHPAIQLVTVYVVERGLILPIQPVDCKSNEIKALPPVIKELARRGVVFAFDAINTQKKLANKSYRHLRNGKYLMIKKPQTRYYISSLNETVEQLAQRIRDYWHVENKVHYVRDVTQCVAGDPPRGEDSARIRVHPLPNLFADFS